MGRKNKFEIYGILLAFKPFVFLRLKSQRKLKKREKDKNGRTMPPRSQIMAA